MLQKVTRTYTPSTRQIRNPYQGFYRQVDAGDREGIRRVSTEGGNLVFLAYALNDFHSSPLSEEKLEELRAALALSKELGLQVIFRAAYGFSEGTGTREPESFELVEMHMTQMSELLNVYREQLVCVQTGMLGPWGEGNRSSLYVYQSDQRELQNQVALRWHWLLSEEIQIQLRTPERIRNAVAAGLPLERMGLHNDALLSSETDLGTYQRRQEELNWIQKQLPHSRTGGETAVKTRFSAGVQAVQEFRQLGLCYLNRDYQPEVLDLWRQERMQGQGQGQGETETFYDYIEKHLGLRIHLSRAVLPKRISSRSKDVKLVLRNTGFSGNGMALQFYMVLKCAKELKYIPIDVFTQKKDELHLRMFLPQLPDRGETELGLWVGYGTPEEGLPFTLANDGTEAVDWIRIGCYEKRGFFHRLKEEPDDIG